MTENAHIIVGAGLAGLFSARVLVNQGYKNIFVIEKSENVGGLLQHSNVQNPLNDGEDFTFDCGTHFVLSPKTGPIKEIIRQDINLSDYHVFESSLQEGHILNGALYQNSGCASVESLSSEVQSKIKLELKALHDDRSKPLTPKNLYEACRHRYGETATQVIYAPAYYKYTGLGLEDLSVSMDGFFAPSRLIIEDQKKSKELKQDEDWDWRIAYADCQDGNSDILKYYPKAAGIGLWLDQMANNLKAEGVQILTDTTLDAVKTNESKIKEVSLSNGMILPCDTLIWSLPAIFLSFLTKTEVPSQKPHMRQVLTIHFLVNQKPIERPYWVTVYDPDFKSYRVTLYDNYSPRHSDVYRITVEILHEDEREISPNLEKEIFKELQDMNIVNNNTKCLWSSCENNPNGFPVLSPGFDEIYMKQIQILESTYKNMKIVGRRTDTGSGQLSVMAHIWNTFELEKNEKKNLAS